MSSTHTKLRSALAIDDFTQRRMALRELFTQTAPSSAIAKIAASLEHKSPDAPDVKPTLSSIRDALDPATLTYLILAEFTEFSVDYVVSAIRDPETHAFPSARAKSGYAFGRPQRVNDEFINTVKANLNKQATETISMLSLQSAINAYDAIRLNNDATDDDIFAAMGEAGLSSETLDGVKSLVSLRDDAPTTAPTLDDDESTIVGAVNDALAPDDKPVSTPVKATAKSKYDAPAEAHAGLINLALGQAGLPAITSLIDEINTLTSELEAAQAAASEASLTSIVTEEKASGDGSIPSGKIVTKTAYEAFGLTRAKDVFGFKVPVWEWDHDHPHVPEIDEDYVFRPFELLRVLYALISNQRCYLHGHTGSGKTTLIEQVAARLAWPFMRVNFDSEITRMDLIGRDVLTNEGGVTASKFVDGILPQMMSGPYIGCFDEIDFVRPDVAYVMQRALEGNGLMLTEDGGRMVKPHKLFRMFATGNTVGQGDEFGMYQGARPQSMAFLDRFTVWVKVDYLKPADRKRLIKARLPKLRDDLADKLNAYVTEHLEAFTTSKVMQPISPRAFLSLGHSMVAFTQFLSSDKETQAITQAIESTILDRATVQDRVVLSGIVQRVFG